MNGYSTADLYESSDPDRMSRNTLSAKMPTLHRQPSRQFDVYGQMPQAQNGFNNNNSEDPMSRFNEARFDPRGFGGGMSTLNGNNYNNYEMNGAQTWNQGMGSFAPNGLGTLGPIGTSGNTTRMVKPARGRTGLPNNWLEHHSPMPNANPYSNMDPPRLGGLGHRNGSIPSDVDDDLIPTAIVIKNIPFAVRKEQLMQLMSEMNLPLPYAFNYHFDNGVFRGLAFANFTSPDETAVVINEMNAYELQGRKLRVEYKKMLPIHERERIEREKRERRGQLEEQHRPLPPTQLHSQASVSSIGSHPPPSTSPLPQLNHGSPNLPPNVDMNDPMTLKWYGEMIVFKSDPSREILIFEAGIAPSQRRVIHTLAHQLGMGHTSHGAEDKRQVHVFRVATGQNLSPSNGNGTSNLTPFDTARNRGLNRAATTDFTDDRHADSAAAYNSTLRGQASLGLLGVQDLSGPFGSNSNLRTAKSYADLRSFTPSPSHSTASFPAGLQANGVRMQQLDGSNGHGNSTPLLTPSSSHQGLGAHRDENMLVNGLGGMSLGTAIGNSGSPRRLRNMFSWDQESHNQQQPQHSTTGPIGSNRTIGTGFDGRSQPFRQPANPNHDRGTGFRRPNGHQTRGSDEFSGTSGPAIIVE